MLIWGQIATADFIFGEPIMVPNVNSDSRDSAPQVSRDGLELYSRSARDEGSHDLWVSRRATPNDPWSAPTALDASLDSTVLQNMPSPSADGLELFFYQAKDIWVLTRENKNDPWDAPQNLGPTINSGAIEDHPCISADGLSLYFVSNTFDSRNSEILVATRLSVDDPWEEPVNLGPNINTDLYESTPFISSDGLSLFFSRGFATANVYVSRRTSTTDTWGPAELFAPINSEGSEFSVSFSDEDATVYFTRGTLAYSSDFKIWQVEVKPVVDFNIDGLVDVLDAFELLEHWGTDDSLYDIAPFPLGDGMVDAKDLVILAEHMLEYEQNVDANDLSDSQLDQ